MGNKAVEKTCRVEAEVKLDREGAADLRADGLAGGRVQQRPWICGLICGATG